MQFVFFFSFLPLRHIFHTILGSTPRLSRHANMAETEPEKPKGTLHTYDADAFDPEDDDGVDGTTWKEVFVGCCCHSPAVWGMILVRLFLVVFFLYFFILGLEILGKQFRCNILIVL
mmetsp:Transcript_18556/g.34554  ORF Transcript_18556/g.34554 Transcript_18556/m.34554 type:complete len:117 (-) Transcript_18556:902-1252(-)